MADNDFNKWFKPAELPEVTPVPTEPEADVEGINTEIRPLSPQRPAEPLPQNTEPAPERGLLEQTGRVLGSIAQGPINAIAQAPLDASAWLANQIRGLIGAEVPKGPVNQLPRIAPSDQTPLEKSFENSAELATDLVTGVKGVAKLAPKLTQIPTKLGAASEVIGSTVGDAVQGLKGNDNLSGMIAEQLPEGIIKDSFENILATDKEDPAAVNAAKSAVEGLMLPIAVKGIVGGTIKLAAEAADKFKTFTNWSGEKAIQKLEEDTVKQYGKKVDKLRGFVEAEPRLTPEVAEKELGVIKTLRMESPELEPYKEGVIELATRLGQAFPDRHLGEGVLAARFEAAPVYRVDEAINIGNGAKKIPHDKLTDVSFSMTKTFLNAFVDWQQSLHKFATANLQGAERDKYLETLTSKANLATGLLDALNKVKNSAGLALRAQQPDLGQPEYYKSLLDKDLPGLKMGMENMQEIMKNVSPEQRAVMTRLMEQAAENGNIVSLIKKSAETTKLEWWVNVWRAGLLTSPKTWAINALSNATMVASRQLEEILAVGPGLVRKGLIDKHGENPITAREIASSIYGMYASLGAAAKSAGKVYIDQAVPQSALTKDWGAKVNKSIPAGWRHLSTNVLTAEDEFFHLLNRGASMHKAAYNILTDIKETGDAIGTLRNNKFDEWFIHEFRNADFNDPATIEKFNKLFFDPNFTPKHIFDKAVDDAKYWTFNSDLGKFGEAINSAVRNHPGAQVIAPFIRTPVNVVKWAIDRTPGLAMVTEKGKAARKAGGQEYDRLIARQMLGGLLVGLGYLGGDNLFNPSEDNIIPGMTGSGPIDAQGYQNAGAQRSSFKTGNTFINAARLEPLSILGQIGADMAYLENHVVPEAEIQNRQTKDGSIAMKQIEDSVLYVAHALKTAYLDRTFMQGVTGAIEAIDTKAKNAGDNFGDVGGRLVGSLVPNIVRHAAQVMDPVVRDPSFRATADDITKTVSNVFKGNFDNDYTKLIPEHIRAGLPGLSETVPARKDRFGDDIKREPGFVTGSQLENMFSPFSATTVKPIKAELLRLDAVPSWPDKKRANKDLTREQYNYLLESFGKAYIPRVTREMNKSSWKGLPDGQKQIKLKEFELEAGKVADARFTAKYQEFSKKKEEDELIKMKRRPGFYKPVL